MLSSAATIVSRAQLPGAVARLERGEELAFGDIKIGLTGVRTEKELIPWASVKDVQVHDGHIRFKQAGKFRPLSSQQAGQIPNLLLFFMLVKAIRGSQQPG